MIYSEYVTTMSTLMVTQTSNPAFVAILPQIINYAELRIYRELDLVSTSTVDATKSFTAGNRALALNPFVVLQRINVISPAGASAQSGTRTQLQPVDESFLDAVWNSSQNSGLPKYFGILTIDQLTNAQTIIVGPWPDAAYTVEAIGTQRPTPLSLNNPSTALSVFFPDLFTAASMVFASGYMRNFGAQADDPRMSQSWETQYQALLASAKTEELRKNFAGPGWTPASEVAQPQNR